MKLPYRIEYYDIKATDFIRNIIIEGYMKPTLQVIWPALSITHRFSEIKYSLPSSIAITMAQARQARRFLREPHYTLIHVVTHTGDLTLLPIAHTLWARPITSQRDRSIVHTKIVHYAERPPLYPQLPPPSAV